MYFDLRIGSKKKQLVHIIERPGLWMDGERLDSLLTDVRTVIANSGIGPLSYGIATGQKDSLDNVVITLIYDNLKRPIAFNALSVMKCCLRGRDVDVLHLGLVVVGPAKRTKGLMRSLYGLTSCLLFLKGGLKPIWISNVTQVPAIVGNACEAFSQVYPNPLHQTSPTPDHVDLAREIMTRHRHVFGVGPEAEFDEDRFVMRNSYTGGSEGLKKSFDKVAKHRNELFNSFLLSHLDYDRGDDFLQLGKLNVLAYGRYLSCEILSTVKSGFRFLLAPVRQWVRPVQGRR